MSEYKYYVQRPDGYDKNSDKVYPLIIYLHGGGENDGKMGRNFEQQVKFHGPWKEHGCDEYTKGTEAKNKIGQFFVVAPHLPEDVEWDAKKVKEVISEVLSNHEYGKSIESGRLYLTGISWGGRGALRVALNDPNSFAAIAVISLYGGRDFLVDIHKLKDMPVWLFHGDQDGLQKAGPPKPARLSKNSEDLFARLKSEGSSKVNLTIYPGEGHSGAWIKAYDDPELYDWFVKQVK